MEQLVSAVTAGEEGGIGAWGVGTNAPEVAPPETGGVLPHFSKFHQKGAKNGVK